MRKDINKECDNWRETARTLADCIMMLDVWEAGEREFDEELYLKSIDLARKFMTKEKEPETG